MSRRRWLVAGVAAGLLVAPQAADASIFSALRGIAKLAKAATKLAKGAGKAAKGVGSAGKLAKSGVAVGGVVAGARAAHRLARVSKLATAERAAVLFASLPDDAGRGAALLARDGDVWHLATRGAGEVDSATDLSRLMGRVEGAAEPVDLFIDPSVALKSADDVPVAVRFADATGAPQAWRTGRSQTGQLRAWPEGSAGELLDAALDGADLASMGWDLAQVSLELGLNTPDGEPDPRGLQLASLGPPCPDGGDPGPELRWQAPSLEALTGELEAAPPARVLLFTDRSAPELRPHLERWATASAHLVVAVSLPDRCDSARVRALVDRAEQDAREGDRLPLVMLAPLTGASILQEDPLLFCGTAAAPTDDPIGLCWGVPARLPPAVESRDTGEAVEEDPMEPPLWVYGLGLLLSIPVLLYVGWKGGRDAADPDG